jgi:putative NADH-flavin reductase
VRLLVLGATGGIGIELVRQTLTRGHEVTAFVRSAERLTPFGKQIVVAQGNLIDTAKLAQVMAGQDAVLSAFGPRVPLAKTDSHLLRDFGVALTSAMKQSGMRRAVVVSTAFLFKDALIPPAYLLGRLFFPSVVADATQMEGVLRRSGLDITIVRPPQLTDRPHTGVFRTRVDRLPGFGFRIPRSDVADFMIQITADAAFLGSVVGVCS